MTRTSFWVLALGVAPLGAFFAALAAEDWDALQWILLLVFPAASSMALGSLLRVSGTSIVAGAVLSTGITWLYVLLLLWYLFEVVGVR